MIRWGLRRVKDGPLQIVEANTGELLGADALAEIRADVWWFNDLVGNREIETK